MNPSQNKQLPEQLDVGALLTNDIYRIPMYQRNYAWEEGEITQLIQDVVDYQKDHQGQNYYIGTLVVFKCPDGAYETIDGQQRLTTLMLLLRAFYDKFANMQDSNSKSTHARIEKCIWK